MPPLHPLYPKDYIFSPILILNPTNVNSLLYVSNRIFYPISKTSSIIILFNTILSNVLIHFVEHDQEKINFLPNSKHVFYHYTTISTCNQFHDPLPVFPLIIESLVPLYYYYYKNFSKFYFGSKLNFSINYP